MVLKTERSHQMGGVVSSIEQMGDLVSLIHLKPIPGQTWASSEVPFGAPLEPHELVGHQVDIKSIISGRGQNKVIRHILESAEVTIETEMPFSLFSSIVRTVKQ